jgi:hypothetical protein
VTRWFLDACSLINLYASGQLGALAVRQGQPFLLVPKVVAEATWIYSRDGNERGERVRIDLGPLIAQNLLEVVSLTPEMRAHYIRLAVELDDGEAMTIAASLEIADAGVITDDEAALKFLAKETGLQASTSLSLLREHLEQAPPGICLDVILSVLISARYVPGPRHPEVAWWRKYVRQERDD